MVKKYDWKITARKFLWATLEIVIVGTLSFMSNKPEFLVLIPVIEAIRNWLKHR